MLSRPLYRPLHRGLSRTLSGGIPPVVNGATVLSVKASGKYALWTFSHNIVFGGFFAYSLKASVGGSLSGAMSASNASPTQLLCEYIGTVEDTWAVEGDTLGQVIDNQTGSVELSTLADVTDYWDFNEASGDRVSKVNSISLVEHGTVGSDTGKIGSAVSFDSSTANYLLIAADAVIAPSSLGWSWVGWIKIPSTANTVAFIHRRGDSGGTQTRFGVEYDTGVGLLAFTGVTGDGSGSVVISSETIPVDEWVFVVVTHDGATLTISVNAGPEDSAAAAHDVPSDPVDLWVGRSYDAGSTADHLLDEMGFWQRKLSSEEATYLYNSGSGRSWPFLI